MNIEIITTGNELLSGLTLDTNFHWASRLLADSGFEVKYHSTVGDYEKDIMQAFRNAKARADVIIVTGGLGPTNDDLTAGVAAKFFGAKLCENPQALDMIKKIFARRKRKLLEINKKPAYLPEGSKIINNNVGTAPGFYYEYDKAIFYFLPGVPKEFKSMMLEFVLADINIKFSDNEKTKTMLLRTFGLKESELALKIQDLETEGVYLGYRSHFPEVHLRLVAKGKSEEQINAQTENLLNKIDTKIGQYIYAQSDTTMEEVVGGLLNERSMTLSLAESCTGGLVSHRITNVSGSSKYFNRAIICYSNESKINDLGVSRLLIENHGAVSTHVAEAMAKGILDLSGTDIGIGITGIAGPGGGSTEKPVGTVHISLACKNGDIISDKFSYHGDREQIKLITSTQSLDMIRKFLINYV
ncbi:MAG: competence/damage-inducible protein A [Candidatus Dadabacteria bacterium]|nr:competence/damage-inducible protein A [Candidatus Dadabacteria bacterium]NIV41961.1 competence/damage-inducible protein A [Candidatus Dadabacteria bacterium]